jgi:hypothetical protein
MNIAGMLTTAGCFPMPFVVLSSTDNVRFYEAGSFHLIGSHSVVWMQAKK